jgi:hypothetical protein
MLKRVMLHFVGAGALVIGVVLLIVGLVGGNDNLAVNGTICGGAGVEVMLINVALVARKATSSRAVLVHLLGATLLVAGIAGFIIGLITGSAGVAIACAIAGGVGFLAMLVNASLAARRTMKDPFETMDKAVESMFGGWVGSADDDV